MTTVTFFNDGVIDLSTPNGKGIKHTIFYSTSTLLNYMKENNIVEDRIITEN